LKVLLSFFQKFALEPISVPLEGHRRKRIRIQFQSYKVELV